MHCAFGTVLASGTCVFLSKCVQTLYLKVLSGNLPGFIVKLVVYNFNKSALLSLMEEPEQSSLCPCLGLMSLPLCIGFEWNAYVTIAVASAPRARVAEWELEEAACG